MRDFNMSGRADSICKHLTATEKDRIICAALHAKYNQIDFTAAAADYGVESAESFKRMYHSSISKLRKLQGDSVQSDKEYENDHPDGGDTPPSSLDSNIDSVKATTELNTKTQSNIIHLKVPSIKASSELTSVSAPSKNLRKRKSPATYPDDSDVIYEGTAIVDTQIERPTKKLKKNTVIKEDPDQVNGLNSKRKSAASTKGRKVKSNSYSKTANGRKKRNLTRAASVDGFEAAGLSDPRVASSRQFIKAPAYDYIGNPLYLNQAIAQYNQQAFNQNHMYPYAVGPWTNYGVASAGSSRARLPHNWWVPSAPQIPATMPIGQVSLGHGYNGHTKGSDYATNLYYQPNAEQRDLGNSGTLSGMSSLHQDAAPLHQDAAAPHQDSANMYQSATNSFANTSGENTSGNVASESMGNPNVTETNNEQHPNTEDYLNTYESGYVTYQQVPEDANIDPSNGNFSTPLSVANTDPALTTAGDGTLYFSPTIHYDHHMRLYEAQQYQAQQYHALQYHPELLHSQQNQQSIMPDSVSAEYPPQDITEAASALDSDEQNRQTFTDSQEESAPHETVTKDQEYPADGLRLSPQDVLQEMEEGEWVGIEESTIDPACLLENIANENHEDDAEFENDHGVDTENFYANVDATA